MGPLTYYISNLSNSNEVTPSNVDQPRLMSRNSPPFGYRSAQLGLDLPPLTGQYSHMRFFNPSVQSDWNATAKPESTPPNFHGGAYVLLADLPLTGEFDVGNYVFSFPLRSDASFWPINANFRITARLYKFRGPRTFSAFLSNYTEIGGGIQESADITQNGTAVVTFPVTNKVRLNDEYLALTVGIKAVFYDTASSVLMISSTSQDAYLRTPSFTSVDENRCIPIPSHARESYTYIAPDGTSYPLDVPRQRAVLSSEGEGVPPINYITQRGPFQDGESFIDSFLQPRVVQLVIRHQLTGRQQYHDARQDLVSVLSPRRQTTDSARQVGTLRKQLYDGSLRDLRALILAGPNFNPRTPQWDEWAYQEVLRFHAFDPVYVDPTLHSQAFAQQGPNLVGPITGPIIGNTLDSYISVDYDGQWRTYPRFTILGPATFIEIENITTGEILRLSYTIPAARTVTIDLAPTAKTVTLDDGTNLLGYLSVDSDLASFHFTENGQGLNNLHAFGSSVNQSTLVTAYWYDRYMGI